MGSKVPYKHWERDEEKEKFWRKTIDDWMASGLSVRGYCRKNRVPESSFNAWRREISMRNREIAITGALNPPVVVAPAVVKDSQGRLIPAKFREIWQKSTDNKRKNQSKPFVPIQVVRNDEPVSDREKQAATVEILSPGGITLKVSTNVDIAFLSKLLHSLENH